MGKLDSEVAPLADQAQQVAAAPAEPQERPMSNKEKRKESKKRKNRDGDEATTTTKVEQPDQDDVQATATATDDQGEPVLSHKEKRLAKKRKLAAVQAGEDPETVALKPAKPATTTATNAPTTIGNTLVGNTPARSAHGVWVGNLNFATHPRELLAWFADRGLKEVTRINMPGGKRSHENNRGFAYLDFPSAAEVQIAVGLSEQHLDGRKLLIKDSSDFTGRPAASTSTATDSNVPNGSVKSVIATLDPSALERPHPNAPASHASAANGPGGAGPTDAAAAAPSLNRTARKILSRQRNPAGPTLFLGNLGFETTSDDIRDMFDRNQRRASEWAPGGNADAKKESKKGKGKLAEGEDGADGEEEEAAESDSSDEDESASGSGDEEQEAEDGDEKKGKKSKKDRKDRGPLDLSKAKDAGIRKIRLGTFEDSGKCKGWAFVDFHLPAQATRALLNLHNHQLNGRKLNVEFASAEAVRRGGLGTRSAVKRVRSQREQGGDGDGDDDEEGGGRHAAHSRGPRRQQGEGQDRRRGGASSFGDADVRALAIDAGSSAAQHGGRPGPRRGDFNGGARSGGGGPPPRRGEKESTLPGGKRAKPGAALAMAQRASEAIVQSTGRKTTFD
ncbi:hypothetical protein C6P46_005787 [Rhodotorula mucilaginosa]|uniref:RRM domain-containing protein n=1 Tax=Rhodotorula mucilaginosa TaxID=5537 RepID=A0A9P6VY47_RHOMI|nr:hypothetical protein C6P46_005787 [Rhodotorula mucilaginosa]